MLEIYRNNHGKMWVQKSLPPYRFRCRPGRSPSLSKRRRSALGALFWTGIPLVLRSPHDAFDAGRRSAHRPSHLDSHPHSVCSPLASPSKAARRSLLVRSRRSRSSTLTAGRYMFYRKEKKQTHSQLISKISSHCMFYRKKRTSINRHGMFHKKY
jgi:hypothetical protein